jgi:hypothetical protein
MNSAIASLMERNNQVLDWFEDYNAADSNVRKQELASRICRDLQAQIAGEQEASDHVIEASNRVIIAQLTEQVLKSSPIDELFDSKVRILGDAFAQHVESEFQ